MYEVLLSLEAEKDLVDIFEYSLIEFGVDKAESYTLSFQDAFDLLGENPVVGKKRDEIKSGLRSIVKEEHIIFYRIMNDQILIVRILHSSRDIKRFL